MSITPHLTILEPIFALKNSEAVIQLEYLRGKVNSLETQLEKAIEHSRKKEAYASTLESDLEHIIMQLKRLEVVK